MALNTNPIYSGVGDLQWTTVLTAINSSYDATAANAATVFSASISGSFVQRIRFKASGSTTATVARVFINNGATSASAANNVLFDEITLPLTTGIQTAATAVYELPMNIALPAAYRILTTLATAQSTGGGWYATAVGGSYTTP
tara:strand:+ start:334 stop:762 length:429 start_codon:yes stop_codon:yes gene_type:complete